WRYVREAQDSWSRASQGEEARLRMLRSPRVPCLLWRGRAKVEI
ncbi:MAG: hypothetical protein AVDCRST_MAG25-1756, partial [uncultured Rubrobacteraceae bacterium]